MLITGFDVILAVELSLISISILKGQKADYTLPHAALSEKRNKKKGVVFNCALNA